LEKKFGLSANEINSLNPEIKERGAKEKVFENSIQKIEPVVKILIITIFYEVKPKQTEFSLTRKLGNL